VTNDREPEYMLVRIRRAAVRELLENESQPVVLINATEQDDGTVELWFRHVGWEAR